MYAGANMGHPSTAVRKTKSARFLNKPNLDKSDFQPSLRDWAQLHFVLRTVAYFTVSLTDVS
jgi:hypothetical protein